MRLDRPARGDDGAGARLPTQRATDAMLVRLADRQKGVFALWQLDADGACARRSACGSATAGSPSCTRACSPTATASWRPHGHRLAAVLAYGPTAVISHRTAAAMWELLPTAQTRIDVTVPGTSRRRRPGIALHRTRELRARRGRPARRCPVTTVTRTLCDLAARGSARARCHRRSTGRAASGQFRLARHMRCAWRSIATRLAAAPPRSRRMLDGYAPAAVHALRARTSLPRARRAAGLPEPRVNCRVAGLEVDIHWPQWHLVVELDGRAYHSDPTAFERDPIRDAKLMRAGCLVLRVTAKRLTYHPDASSPTSAPSPRWPKRAGRMLLRAGRHRAVGRRNDLMAPVVCLPAGGPRRQPRLDRRRLGIPGAVGPRRVLGRRHRRRA